MIVGIFSTIFVAIVGCYEHADDSGIFAPWIRTIGVDTAVIP